MPTAFPAASDVDIDEAAIDEQRTVIREDLAATLRLLAARGFQYGLAGHATVRDAGPEERYWVNPAGIGFARVTLDDLVLVDADGAVVDGRHRAHGYESQLEVHRRRPELRAGLHVHSLHTFAWSSAGGLLAPLTTDSSWLQGIQVFRESFDQSAPGSSPPRSRMRSSRPRSTRNCTAPSRRALAPEPRPTPPEVAVEHGYTLRRVLQSVAGAFGHGRFVGTPTQAADRIEQCVDAGAADGFVVFPNGWETIRLLTEQVVPLLRARERFRAEYSGTTLRDHFGLPPVSAPARAEIVVGVV
ncbi:class II aldolase/adducin family protein [Microbacterium trichothecenolyticum]|uniref:Class II aldolase/adducin N-terminal domain-containing protein n=1 Tax=Microbacterium trichothecenolyticum TaxID=69370 RepID=A0ABU0TSJ8_MICTR|nr:class II aldolase/adducin family protein [Microbacterium trichothecenolyticum]MDQ1122623.1 hypothetical protein [Microbacterium trichothecenolyticum]